MTEFVEMLVKAKSGDPQATEELLNMYRPLLCKEALVGGIFDEDGLFFANVISSFNGYITL